jgi:hypothetical protein
MIDDYTRLMEGIYLSACQIVEIAGRSALVSGCSGVSDANARET